MKSAELITDLENLVKQHIHKAKSFKNLPSKQLNQKTNPDKWSVLECLEHLNRYGNFYIPEITQRIKNAKHKTHPAFKSGVLGNYFANLMLPKEKPNNMRTLKSMNPINSNLNENVLDTFIQQQYDFLELLNQAKAVNLTKTKSSISISTLIKLRLGDTFRFIIYHNQRHLNQAEYALKQ